jgi:lipopolysaccharide biosynthesis regulator YciM
MERGDLDGAVKRWEELLASDMDYFTEVAPRLEKALFESGRFDELEGILLRLLERHPSDALLLASLARFYSKKGEISRGIALLEDVRERVEDKGLALCLALLLLKDGRKEEALSVMEESDRIPSMKESMACGCCGARYETSLGFCRACCSYDSIRKDETVQK